MEVPHITPDQSECLLRVMEAAPQVCRRHQFFVWTQGDFQRWLPHTVALCGAYDREQRDLSWDLFNSLPLSIELVNELTRPRAELQRLAVHGWRRGQMQATRVALVEQALAPELAAGLIDAGYRQLMVHGLTRPSRPDELESLFVLLQHNRFYDDEALQAFEMLLPCLHLTYLRVATTERGMANDRVGSAHNGVMNGMGSVPVRPAGITEREREILRWVRDGLSNQQISQQLGISALTVKNHVQKILRKLGAANRAQAVAKAMSMNALGQASTSSQHDRPY